MNLNTEYVLQSIPFEVSLESIRQTTIPCWDYKTNVDLNDHTSHRKSMKNLDHN